MKVAILLLVGIVLVSAYTELEYQNAFASWMQETKKSYTAAEFQTRYTIFKSNMDFVRDHNAKNTGFVLGMTIMADLTNEEYQQIYLGTHIDASNVVGASTPKKFMAPPKKISVGTTYNLTIDWTTKGIVTPIKNQGQCGSCWSFSTTGSTEGAHAQKTGNLVSLSEQNLMDCSTAEGDNGCGGGLMSDAFTYIIKNGGIDTEESYPYQGVQGTCKYNAANSGATVASYTNVTSEDETALETAASKQPVSVAIDAKSMEFQLYKSGIYHNILCSQTKLDHGVLVVGYGSDGSSNGNFWKVKNSWGTIWGMEGYIYMSKDRDNNCGIATMASYPTV